MVTEYLNATGLQDELDALGFNLVGYGCTTCIGNSGPLPEAIEAQIRERDLNDRVTGDRFQLAPVRADLREAEQVADQAERVAAALARRDVRLDPVAEQEQPGLVAAAHGGEGQDRGQLGAGCAHST